MRNEKTEQQINDARQAIKQAENLQRSNALNRILLNRDADRLKFDLALVSAYAVLITALCLGQAVAAILGR